MQVKLYCTNLLGERKSAFFENQHSNYWFSPHHGPQSLIQVENTQPPLLRDTAKKEGHNIKVHDENQIERCLRFSSY